MSSLTLPPLSLYIHFPWCVKKCPYCDFNSHALKSALPEEHYIDALIMNLEHSLAFTAHRPLQSIFMGGGTPSLFSEHAIARLLDHIQRCLPLADNLEITLEANPGTVDRTRFIGYRHAGVNRISLGVQSFQDSHLHRLGRIHSADDAKHAIEAVDRAGFDRLNIDLMFGLPDQTVEEGLSDLHTAMALAPEHISWYELTIEPNTLFWHHPPTLPEEGILFELYQQGQATLAHAGYHPYEVSAYTRQAPCRHNMNYWEFGDYLAIGAGAHGKITQLETDSILRYHHFRHPKQFMDASQRWIQECATVAFAQLPFEFMLNALRLTHGVPIQYFCERTGLPLHTIATTLAHAQHKGWLVEPTTVLQATPLGYRFLNDLISLFLANSDT